MKKLITFSVTPHVAFILLQGSFNMYLRSPVGRILPEETINKILDLQLKIVNNQLFDPVEGGDIFMTELAKHFIENDMITILEKLTEMPAKEFQLGITSE